MIHSKIALSLVSILPAFALRAQQVPATTSPAVPVAASKSPAAADDAVLAGWLAAECKGEVTLAQIAVRKAESSEVEQFAKLLIAEHKNLEGELRPFTNAAEPKSALEQARDSKVLLKDRKAAEASNPGKAQVDAPFDHVALVRELSEQSTAAQAKLLEAAASSEFDRSFMQAQVRAHARAVIMVDVFHGHASDDLRPTLDKIGKMLKSHHEQAMTLCKKCEAAAMEPHPQRKQK